MFRKSRCPLLSTAVLLFLLLTVCAPLKADPAGALVIVGGGQLSDSILSPFVELAGDKPQLVVIPTATGDKTLPTAEANAKLWADRGIPNAALLHTRERQQANDSEFVAPLKTATAVWFNGGQQSRLAAAYVGTQVERELQALLKRGGVIGGTSAGAAIQSRVMIQSGYPVPKIGRGFDFVSSAIIDQHFLNRNRVARLVDAVRQYPERLGLGIDESTALIIRSGQAQVVGDGYVTTIRVPPGQQDISLGSFRDGDTIVLPGMDEKTQPRQWAIGIHGGAGTIPQDATPETVQAWRDGLQAALQRGRTILEAGGTSLDAVEATIRVLEDNPLFNAGKGAVFNSAEQHELDASIMDGRNLAGGAVAGVSTVRNPIQLARRVMENTPHVLLSGSGAEQFATEQQVERVPNAWFSTEARRRSWRRVRDKAADDSAGRDSLDKSWKYGTVGCVVLDSDGNLAAGTSTGGLTNKKFGRVGDSPILGAGTYADNGTCAVSATGTGEEFIRHAVAAQISLLMQHRSWTLKQAADYVLTQRLQPGDGGVIAVDRQGQIEWSYTSPGMFRAAADSSGRWQVLVRDEEPISQ